jgi:YD repeat-containing protein
VTPILDVVTLSGPDGAISLFCQILCSANTWGAVAPGEPVTASAGVWTDDPDPTSEDQVQVTWTVSCGTGAPVTVTTQTVTAPEFLEADGALTSASFDVGANCPQLDQLEVLATATVVGQTTSTDSSAVTAAGPMGPGWSLPWQSSLAVQDNGDVILTAENGDQYHYVSNGDGTFSAPSGPRSVLAAVISGTAVTGYTLTAPDNHVVGYGYTGGRLTSATTPGGASGEKSTYAYSAAGLLASIQDPDGNFRVRNTYDSSGRVTSQEDGTGAVTTFSYTTAGDGLAETDVTHPGGGITTDLYSGQMLLESIDALGGAIQYVYNQYLEPIAVTDPLGNITTSAYDSNGNLTSQTDPLGNVQTWTYDSHDNLTKYANPGGHVYGDTYNAMDEPTSMVVPGGTAGETTTYTYDAAGNLTSSVDPRGNATGASAASFTSTYSYNTAGQLTSVTNPDGDVTATTYDSMGFPLTITDPLGHLTTYAYNSAEEVASVSAPDGGITKYAYDLAGNMITRTDPRQPVLDLRLRRRQPAGQGHRPARQER